MKLLFYSLDHGSFFLHALFDELIVYVSSFDYIDLVHCIDYLLHLGADVSFSFVWVLDIKYFS